MRESSIVTFGSPLIDVIVNVDDSFLNKFNLEPNNATAVGEESEIFEAIQASSPKYVVGGCALNTARVLKHVSKDLLCTVIGAVGDDDYAQLVKRQLDQDHVRYVFVTVPKTTGRCAVLLNEDNRSLCTDLGASKFFTLEHLKRKEVWDYVQTGSCIYVPGFFLSVSVDCVLTIAKNTTEKIFALNLSAPFIVERYSQEIFWLLPYVDLLFGNESELRALARAFGFTSKNLNQISKYVYTLNCRDKSMVMVITRGSKSVFLVHNNEITKHRVKTLDKSRIKDTSAAGDAFVGGFLGSFVSGESLDACVSCGINVAQTVIQSSGCWFE
ncbi:hypothetical protein RN001_014203 [Aquatica leii]|uniref:Adenosine kinase n=1 Tax=Aquatica leii TaxID=1421715 RepID=A0AAN7SLY0_9COLE|nr:hypothetical protein RN001_014203 [Aquatica leii]